MPGSTRSYWTLLTLQSAGTALLYWLGVPLYRSIVRDPAAHEVRLDRMLWFLSGVLLMQVPYWLCFRIRPRMPGRGNPVLAHLVLFLSRLVFVFATAVFSYVFILQNLDFQLPPLRYAVLLAVLFSLYCYMLELERLGKALLGPPEQA